MPELNTDKEARMTKKFDDCSTDCCELLSDPITTGLEPEPVLADKLSSGKPIKTRADRPWSVFGEKLESNSNSTFTHASLFSGCGGFDLGFRQAGFKTVFANDIDRDACDTFERNLGEIHHGDIRMTELPQLDGQLDVLTAGFPCQPFSNAGSRKGVNDDRGTLFQTAIDIVEKLNPKVVVFENVRGLLSFKNGERPLVEEICSQLSKLGYNVVFKLIDASQHNVPQRRLRLFIVGVKNGKGLADFTFPRAVRRDDLTLEHTILDVPMDALHQDELMKLNPQAIHLGKLIPEGGSWKNIPYDQLPERLQRISDNIEKYRWPNFYRRFHRSEIAGTITAAFKPENAGVWHPTEGRIFSVREISRIQTFPDWYVFAGKSVKSKYKQIGNAVPPRLAFEIAKSVKESILGRSILNSLEFRDFGDFIEKGRPLKPGGTGVRYVIGE
jgi:DNA (cytosine-5)-methyltransferase 1